MNKILTLLMIVGGWASESWWAMIGVGNIHHWWPVVPSMGIGTSLAIGYPLILIIFVPVFLLFQTGADEK